MNTQVSPSILSADFGKINEEIVSIEPFADSIHLDIMDGHFVPNLTFGAPIIKCLQTNLLKICHLMVLNPENYVEDIAKAGGDIFQFHIEATKDPETLIKKIHDAGMKAGVAIKPKTPLEAISPILPMIENVLIMTVEPGFGGQSFMHEPVEKIRAIREEFPDLDIEVDGGINAETASIVIEAGANVLVAGSFIFQAEDREKAIERLRG